MCEGDGVGGMYKGEVRCYEATMQQEFGRLERVRRRNIRSPSEWDFTDDMRLVSGRNKSQREEKFRQRFLEVPEEETLINYYSCAFNKDYYLQHGALYVTSNYICFRSNIFGHERKIIIPTSEVRHIDKVNTFRLIPSGLVIVTGDEKYHFESFLNRQSAYETLKHATGKNNGDGPATSPVHARRREDSSTKRFIKSQSSCSLDRKEHDGNGDGAATKEDFLRPLSATVMHDYVTRRSSRAALMLSAGQTGSLVNHCNSAPDLVASDPQQEHSRNNLSQDSVDGCGSHEDLVRDQSHRRQTVDKTGPSSQCKSTVDFGWDHSTDNDPAFTVRISMRALLRIGYLLCLLLTVTALLSLSGFMAPSRSTAPSRVSGNTQKISLNNAELGPLNETLQLLNSVCDATQKLLLQTQRHLQRPG
ncbi:putative GRAM domain-containing protein 3 [Hypsibius exemplaris]|uniref:GRAM domain-containing protein 3 n=1 Tax=Hypsibius exemplaris TaxID=2072580 RepID=A0A1W0WKE4_HYPEX|nr:putative GRAM domain-containing protein 3 [Hypsibius exemplaris]